MSTPAWSTATTNTTAASAQVNQFLGTHTSYVSYAGTAVATVAGTLGLSTNPGVGAEELINQFGTNPGVIPVTQPFQISSGTTIDRITIPVVPVQCHGGDLTVQIQTDSGGNPSGTLAGAGVRSVTIPREFIMQAGLADRLPNYNQLFSSAWQTTVTNGKPPSPMDTFNFTAGAFDGTFIAISGGKSGSNVNNTVFSAQSAVGGFSTWSQQTPIPLPASGTPGTGLYYHTMVAAGGYLVLAGGLNSAGTDQSAVYTATFQSGIVGPWTATNSTPAAFHAAAACAITSTQTGQANTSPSVVIVGGQNATTPVSALYFGTVSSTGAVTWVQGQSLPAALTAGHLQYVNGWLVWAGGSTTDTANTTPNTAVYIAKVTVLPNGSISLGSWQTAAPQLPHSVANGGSVVVNNNFVLLGGVTTSNVFQNSIFSLRVGTAGVADAWVTQQATFTPNMGIYGNICTSQLTTGRASSGNVTINVSNVNGVTGAFGYVGQMDFVSVPLHVTGLATATTYHCVMQQTVTYNYNQLFLQIAANSSSSQYKIFIGGSWVGAGATIVIPITVWQNGNNPAGGPVHWLDDTGQKWNWEVYQQYTGQLLAYGEYAGTTRTMQFFDYDSTTTGSLVDTLASPQGWANSLWGQSTGVFSTVPQSSQYLPLEYGA